MVVIMFKSLSDLMQRKKHSCHLNRLSVSGFTLAELMIVISLLMLLSFSLYQGMRIGSRELKVYTGTKQAQALANAMQTDFELAEARQPINSLTDFLGFLYTQHWPVSENGLFSLAASTDLSPISKTDLNLSLDDKGCLELISVFLPCWSQAEGLRVIYADQEMRPFLDANTYLSNSSADIRMVQNFYFQQKEAWSYTMADTSDDKAGTDEADIFSAHQADGSY